MLARAIQPRGTGMVAHGLEILSHEDGSGLCQMLFYLCLTDTLPACVRRAIVQRGDWPSRIERSTDLRTFRHQTCQNLC